LYLTDVFFFFAFWREKRDANFSALFSSNTRDIYARKSALSTTHRDRERERETESEGLYALLSSCCEYYMRCFKRTFVSNLLREKKIRSLVFRYTQKSALSTTQREREGEFERKTTAK
jgi:hypothetical protein